MSNTIDLTLDGLSCGHCVKRVKESLEQRPDVEQADVTVTEAHVTGSASAEAPDCDHQTSRIRRGAQPPKG